MPPHPDPPRPPPCACREGCAKVRKISQPAGRQRPPYDDLGCGFPCGGLLHAAGMWWGWFLAVREPRTYETRKVVRWMRRWRGTTEFGGPVPAATELPERAGSAGFCGTWHPRPALARYRRGWVRTTSWEWSWYSVYGTGRNRPGRGAGHDSSRPDSKRWTAETTERECIKRTAALDLTQCLPETLGRLFVLSLLLFNNSPISCASLL